MSNIYSCIEDLRRKLERHRKEGLRETPTRTIFIDPLLKCLGWDVTDPDEVHLEYPTIDNKSVDYAPKLNRKPVLFIEAKGLSDQLNDVKAITQVVGYAANAGVEWCILTNGINYKVYKSTEKVEAPDKLLYEVSIDPKDSGGRPLQEVVDLLNRFSKEAMANEVLDEIGEEVFTTGKIRKALDILFLNPPPNLIKIIRSVINDEKIKPKQIEEALKRLWAQTSGEENPIDETVYAKDTKSEIASEKKEKEYHEESHLEEKPQEVIELYKTIDKFCRELDPKNIQKKYQAKTINYLIDKKIFCSVHITKSGLRIWLKLIYSRLDNPPGNVRDVSNLGHWGAGDVEVSVNNQEQLKVAKLYITKSFENSR